MTVFSNLGLKKDKNYIISHATSTSKGWAVINKDEKNLALPGILYPIKEGSNKGYLKTIQTGTNLIYGTGVSQTAYFDYEAIYISESEYLNRPTNQNNTDALTVNYYNLENVEDFEIIKDYKTIQTIVETVIKNVNDIKDEITVINQSYLPLNGSKAMEGDLDLGANKLSKLDIKESSAANVRTAEFKFGAANKRGLLHPADPPGRALVDNSDQTKTNLTLNFGSDWQNTTIGGKIYLDNLNTSVEDFSTSKDSENSLLLIDNAKQVLKSNNLLNSLLGRISELEKKSAIPIGMIAIWGKPAPFPEGWEEYVPLRGRMPVGFDSDQSEFNNWNARDGGNKNKKLTIDEIPKISPINGLGIQKGGTFGGINGLTLADTGTGDYAPGQLIKPFGGDQPFSILNPYRVVHFIEYTGIASDITKPTTPTNLTASNIGTTSLTLSWNESTDNVGVTNYLIYKDNSNTPLVELGKDVLTYNITGLSANTPYIFHVKAKDAAGNLSNPATINTATINSASTPTLPTLQHAYYGGENMTLQWPNFIDVETLTYELYRSINGGEPVLLKTSTDTFYYDTLSNGVTYSYQIRINHNGYISPYSNTVTVTGRP
ncbi:hypothetical protein J2Y38_004848 [Flavobacterium sp. 2755]|uniref:fibronectin type III domain-containing protein n=1 Tax=Flavobacterium sp. 2755 TaxID=2817765 RepID=UPI00285E45FC|nr:fibronectin type III domain-containing protein [Flavobacterium sp. 2755]MDR6764614.1 hypothetical protein [Flavobacterium sp. 2755]